MPDLVSVDWPSVRDLAIHKLAEHPPHPEVEDEMIALFQSNPKAVLAALEQVATQIANGSKIRSGWRVWRRAAAEAIATRSNVSVRIDDDRDHQVELARRWTVTSGMFLQTPEAMENQLFGIPERLGSTEELEAMRDQLSAQYPDTFDSMVRPLMEAAIRRSREPDAPQLTEPNQTEAILGPWASDTQLRGEMAELWLKLRPVGEQTERDFEGRAIERRAQADRHQAVLEARREELDHVQVEAPVAEEVAH